MRGFWGLFRTSLEGPCSTITPPSMNSTRSATSRANCISCVTTTMVMPDSASLRITLSTSPTSSGSSAEVGSSNKIASGCMASARAMATRCCWPPDSCGGWAFSFSARPTLASNCLARSITVSRFSPLT
ncbi:hypothetical protein BH10PSE16_BH10PSE16_03150 [soil metagenome]